MKIRKTRSLHRIETAPSPDGPRTRLPSPRTGVRRGAPGRLGSNPYAARFIAAAALWAILISACSIAHLGWLRNSPEVDRAFEALQPSPGYRYWYLYLENSPYAVLGLNSEYRIEDISWTEVAPGSEVFQKVVGLVRGFPVPGSRTSGAVILDARGERIGVWYSSMSAGIRIDPDTKVVSIMTGTPWMSGDGSDDGRD
jgi:hypothetical protein